jgi:hypothetical protein
MLPVGQKNKANLFDFAQDKFFGRLKTQDYRRKAKNVSCWHCQWLTKLFGNDIIFEDAGLTADEKRREL